MSKKAVVLGMGVSGRAAARLLTREGYHVTGIDSHVNRVDEVALVKSASEITSRFDFVVVSPGISPFHADYQMLLKSGVELIGEAEWGCRFLTSKAIAITGTNGKTTVTSLVAHVLNQVGIPAEAIGNIGLPISDYVLQENQKEKVAIVELSSYQLDTLKAKVFSAGALLNITPDHLDRYHSLEAYARSKWHLAQCLKEEAPFFVEEHTYRSWAPLLEKVKANLYAGKNHIESNFLAAEGLCAHLGVEKEDFRRAASSFVHLPHRIESVATIDGVQWIDDSKGTNVDAVIQAVRLFPGPIVLIAGGVDKGSSYLPWIEEFKGKVSHICALGQAAPLIADAISSIIPVSIYGTMAEAVEAARESSVPGGVVLLSPGCSSFDMFRDYHHRGEVFKQLVKELKEGCHR